MPELQYPKNPNSDTAFVVQEDGTKNRALMTAPQDTSTLELPKNANSCKGYVTIDGKKQRVILTAAIGGGGGDQHNLGYYTTQAALEEAYPTAEAGDWAIVGATDTVWVWDSDNQEWVDSDQKGQVTSVNNQTGAVVLDAEDVLPSQTGYSGRVLGTDGFVAGWVKPEIVQRSTMPQASEDELGNIYQFTGTTDANYTNGYFYKCVSDGGNPATYSWSQVSVQPAPSGLPDQTGQSGKFLTTDGTDASWVWGLKNKATGTSSFSATSNVSQNYTVVMQENNGTYTGGTNCTVVGTNANVTGYGSVKECVAIGNSAIARASKSTAIGVNANTYGSGIAIGYRAQIGSNATNAIQLGQDGSNYISNDDANTFKVANANGNFEIMSADGTVPTARLTKVNTTATLAVADWSSSTQTVTVSGVKADSVVFVSPAPASASDYASAGILCTSQSADSLTFTCTTTPTNAITVNVVCM